jgi:hypothetical protein
LSVAAEGHQCAGSRLTSLAPRATDVKPDCALYALSFRCLYRVRQRWCDPVQPLHVGRQPASRRMCVERHQVNMLLTAAGGSVTKAAT